MHLKTCPKCSGGLQQESFTDQIAFYRCVDCLGLLMSVSAFEKLKESWLSESIVDPPPFPVGRNDQNETIDCPSCSREMSKMFDSKQTHVCLDYCAECELLYFDAGEFTDLKQLTMMDHLWSFLAKLRKR